MTALYSMKPVMLLLLVAVGGPAAPSLCAADVTGTPLQPHPATFRRSLQQQISSARTPFSVVSTQVSTRVVGLADVVFEGRLAFATQQRRDSGYARVLVFAVAVPPDLMHACSIGRVA